MRVALLDYGAGNLTSVRKALAAVGAVAFTPADPVEIADAAAAIVPGVGHFAATAVLDRPWRDGLTRLMAAGRPLLGICLGLQWLFEGSDEAPDLPGLGVLRGRCALLGQGRLEAARPGAEADGSVKVPHVGWNALDMVSGSPLVEGIPSGTQAYFTHSYAAPVTADCVAATTHGERFASIVARGAAFGVQFHPEKSGSAGLTLLRNFLQLAR